MALNQEEVKDLLFLGPDSSHIPEQSLNALANLMAFSTYGELDKLFAELLVIHPFSVEIIKQAAYKLYLACELRQEH